MVEKIPGHRAPGLLSQSRTSAVGLGGGRDQYPDHAGSGLINEDNNDGEPLATENIRIATVGAGVFPGRVRCVRYLSGFLLRGLLLL